jgi:hypothetical protein
MNPDATYQAETARLNITVPDFTRVSSLSDGTETATLSLPGDARTVPTGGWRTWSSPPDSESATPRLLYAGGASETISLSVPVATFGIEVEPNSFMPPTFDVTATFKDSGGDIIGVITRTTSGQAGARLFAGTVLSGNPISSVTLTIDAAAQGFGVAQFRYATATPSGPLVIASSPTGPVLGLDHFTVTFNMVMDPKSFTADQVNLTDPNGDAVPIADDGITTNDNQTFTVSFDPQTILGDYHLVLGPNITDPDGTPMDQDAAHDADGDPPGQKDDVYTATFTVTDELIVNGGFETGNFSGWGTAIASATLVGNMPNPPHSGMFCAELGAVGVDDHFWQDLATTPGQSYHISFWYLSDGGSPADLHVTWGGVEIYSEINSPAHPYVLHEFDMVATGTTTRLDFGAYNTPTFNALDDVSVKVMSAAAPGHSGHSHPAILDAAAALPGGGTRTTPVTAPSAASLALPLRSDKPAASAAAAVRQDTASTDAFFANIQRSDSLLAPAVLVGDSFVPADSARLALWAPEAI